VWRIFQEINVPEECIRSDVAFQAMRNMTN
jgi:hypothetical protein